MESIRQMEGIQRIEGIQQMEGIRRLREQEEQEGFRENRGAGRFFRSGRAGDWRRHLTATQVRAVADAHHRVTSAMGYPMRTPAG